MAEFTGAEFTGERVVPGQVNDDLWSEHFARYAFARRLVDGRRVLDAGSGSGYGSAELAQSARIVVGIDVAISAMERARKAYSLSNVQLTAASCESMPFRDGCFDAVIAFEVIEHLKDYPRFIAEAARVLTTEGLFCVSTPNKRYYAESRAQTGPNPFHEHEFEAEEFRRELSAAFPYVAVLLQNRVESFAFYPAKTFWPVDACLDRGAGDADDAHFFVALCSKSPLAALRSFVYVPRAANVLREREQHIRKLEQELKLTCEWLRHAQSQRDDMIVLHDRQKEELEARNRWADDLNRQLSAAHQRVGDLQSELAMEQAEAVEVAAGYEGKVAQLESENAAKTRWAEDTEARLTSELTEKQIDLAECVRLLDEAEATVTERTLWAQDNERSREHLAHQLNAARSSKWLKLGKLFGLGPKFQAP